MNDCGSVNQVILATAVASGLVGLGLFLLARKPGPENSPRATNTVAWLLISLFPVLVLFSFFPNSKFTGTLLGFSATGATALFVFIWWYGAKRAIEAIAADQASAEQQKSVERMAAQIRELRDDLDKCQNLNAAIKQPEVLSETQVFRCPLKSFPQKCIGLITGNIQGVTVADIWVNSENDNMQMSRWYEGTISGMIRYLGARKDNLGEIVKGGDIIASELGQIMKKKNRVQPTTVLITSSGELARTHNVKAILHVASVQGTAGVGYLPIANIQDCITTILQAAEGQDSKVQECKSVLMPLLGTGAARANIGDVAQRLINRTISYLEGKPKGRIETIYFIARTSDHFEICKELLRTSGKLEAALFRHTSDCAQAADRLQPGAPT